MYPHRRTLAPTLLVTIAITGCVSRQNVVHSNAIDKPPEQQTLADLQPPVTLPERPQKPAAPAPIDALQAYARGRDALLRNQKPDAQKYLAETVGIDPDSAIAWRDLGYAQTGRDDAKAAAAFRTACGLDPADADSRLQLARLLLAGQKTDDAVTELRLARLSPDYADDAGMAAVVDLLLGQLLEQAHYRTAALECYESLLSVLDDGGIRLRGRPELSDVLQRPGVLVLRIADLAEQCGKHDRAIGLYRRLQQQEPQLAGAVELRLAQVELAKGDAASATQRALAFVTDAGASPLSLAMFDELFEPHGGPTAALQWLDRAPATRAMLNPPYAVDLFTLRSHLHLKAGDPAAAVAALRPAHPEFPDIDSLADSANLAYVRQTVHAYRSADPDGDQDVAALLLAMSEHPKRWPLWQRAWAILTQPAQAHPLTAERLLAVDLSKSSGLVGTRNFVVNTIFANQGRSVSSKWYAAAAATARPSFDVASALAAPPLDLPEPDVGTPKELAVLIDDYRDDPDLLTATLAGPLRAKQIRLVLDALAIVSAKRPADVIVARAYAQVLAGDDQRTEASAVLDKAAAAVSSANELYEIASQYGGLGDEKSAERLLRKAHERDATLPPVCNDLGYLLIEKGRELPFAEQLLTTAATAEPDNAAYLDSLGWLLYKRSKFDDAAERLQQAIDASSPVDPVVLDHAGDAFYRVKQPHKSAERWRQAVDAIKERGTADPQLRLRIEQKLRQLKDKSPVVVAPVAEARAE